MFITVTAGAGPLNGNGSVTIQLQPNMTGASRSGTVTVAGQTVTVTQLPFPSLSIALSHVGNFALGQPNAQYSITVSNAAGKDSTSGIVSVTDTLPAGMTLSSMGMSGPGWSCPANTCTRSDALTGGASYPAIIVTVNVALNAASPLVNQVSVSGGGSATAGANDSTIISVNQPTLILDRKALNFHYTGSLTTGKDQVVVSFTGGFGIPWTAASNQSNITVFPASGNGNGTFQVSATPGPSGIVTVTAPGATGSPKQIQVNISAVTLISPIGSFDTPTNNTSGIAGAIPVTGWALSNIEINSSTGVQIWREPVANEPAAANGLVFIGNAVFVTGARPDVEAQYSTYPFSNRAGWGYQLLTNFLPNQGNGTFKLHAIATDVANNMTDLGTRTIIADNAHAAKPFGTIDTPAQGGTASGAQYLNFGWALTPGTFCIPQDGSTITVVVDSVPQPAHPVYNQFRSDIAGLFPGYCNSGGAVGY
jgi:uncharacterized repeat protein (TIGR01451 family)